jgi:SNF2 family DNA or RNA helicase
VTVALCNLVGGCFGLNLTAATHVIFQNLNRVPTNQLQAEDRCHWFCQKHQATVEYLLADGTLDGYIARLLERKLRLVKAVEADEVPDASILGELQAELQRLSPALM